MTKKFLGILLACAMMLAAFSACSSDTAESAADTAADAVSEVVETVEEAADTAAEEAGEAVTEAVEEVEETVEEVVETVVEEVKEEEPEPTYEVVWELDYSKMEDDAEYADWKLTNIEELRIENGMLCGTSTSGDPYMCYIGEDWTGLNCADVQLIKIGIWNYGTAYDGQFFFTTPAVTWSESASVKFCLYSNIDDGDDIELNEIEITPDDSVDWEDTCTGFRIDPIVTEGDFAITYIQFLKQTN